MNDELLVRRFNDTGIHSVHERLDAIKRGDTTDLADLCEREDLIEVVKGARRVTVVPFASRLDAAKYFTELLAPLWTWLAVAWADVLAPVVKGARKIGDHPRWVLEADNYQRYYRHLLAGPYNIYTAHVDDPFRALAVLINPVSSPGEVVEQFASRQDFVTSPGVMAAVTQLYVGAGRKMKRGAGGKGGGSSRRLADVLQQLDLTFDLQSIEPSQLLEILPKEFDRYQRPEANWAPPAA
jgi:hypothetical protein